jgi:hypothetical protein
MKLTQPTRFLPMLGMACALGMAPAMAQTATGTMAPVPSTPSTPMQSAPSTPMQSAPSTTPAVTPQAAKPVTKLSKSVEFVTVAAAAAHCPADTVVWSSLSKSHSFHLSGSHYYGKTKHGAYVCKGDALAAGFHQAKS